jgi:hypothetical protein
MQHLFYLAVVILMMMLLFLEAVNSVFDITWENGDEK